MDGLTDDRPPGFLIVVNILAALGQPAPGLIALLRSPQRLVGSGQKQRG